MLVAQKNEQNAKKALEKETTVFEGLRLQAKMANDR